MLNIECRFRQRGEKSFGEHLSDKLPVVIALVYGHTGVQVQRCDMRVADLSLPR